MRIGVALAAALLALSACEPTPRTASTTTHATARVTDDSSYYGAGPRVAVVGDSLTNNAHDQIHAALPGRAVMIASMAGEGFTGGPWTEVLDAGEPIMASRARAFAATEPQVAVVALGTNDAWQEGLADRDPLPAVAQVLASFEDACTVGVLITPGDGADHYDSAKAEAINGALRVTADVVVDWRLHATEEDISGDGIHLTPRALEPYAAAVAAGAETCLTSVPAPVATPSQSMDHENGRVDPGDPADVEQDPTAATAPAAPPLVLPDDEADPTDVDAPMPEGAGSTWTGIATVPPPTSSPPSTFAPTAPTEPSPAMTVALPPGEAVDPPLPGPDAAGARGLLTAEVRGGPGGEGAAQGRTTARPLSVPASRAA